MTKQSTRPDSQANPRSVRTSVSLPENEYLLLERIAKNQRVSMAWVVREAVHSYISDRSPTIEDSHIMSGKKVEDQ